MNFSLLKDKKYYPHFNFRMFFVRIKKQNNVFVKIYNRIKDFTIELNTRITMLQQVKENISGLTVDEKKEIVAFCINQMKEHKKAEVEKEEKRVQACLEVQHGANPKWEKIKKSVLAELCMEGDEVEGIDSSTLSKISIEFCTDVLKIEKDLLFERVGKTSLMPTQSLANLCCCGLPSFGVCDVSGLPKNPKAVAKSRRIIESETTYEDFRKAGFEFCRGSPTKKLSDLKLNPSPACSRAFLSEVSCFFQDSDMLNGQKH